MSRADRRAAEKRARQSKTSQTQLSGVSYAIMAVVTFAMIFSSFGWVLTSGGTTGLWVMGVLMCALVVTLGVVWYRRRNELE